MGMPARREVVNLDANIVTGLLVDERARTYVREVRRNGARVMLSPGVIREIARTPRQRRERLVDAAIEHCDGFVNLPFYEIFEREIRALNDGIAVPQMPEVPIAQLNRIRDDVFARKTATELDVKGLRQSVIKMFEDLGRAGKKVELEATFEVFLKGWLGDIFRMLLDVAMAHGCPKLAPPPREQWMNEDKHAIVIGVAFIGANLYRKLSGEMLKGEGSYRDIWNVMEVAHSSKFLTRDKELFECGKLVRGVITSGGPHIVWVPLPGEVGSGGQEVARLPQH